MKYGTRRLATHLGRFEAWVTIGRVTAEWSGPWSWAFQVYIDSRAFQFQVFGWTLQILWWG